MQDSANRRDDEYRGRVENRLRLLDQVPERICAVFPAGRVGVRFSPLGQANDMGDSDPDALLTAAGRLAGRHGLACVHAVELFFDKDTLYGGGAAGHTDYPALPPAASTGERAQIAPV